MTLQERQKRETEMLENEIDELWKQRRASKDLEEINDVVAEIDACYLALDQVKSNPETYFKNIDEQE